MTRKIFESIQVGDKVIVGERYGYTYTNVDYHAAEVIKVGKNTFKVENQKSTFSKECGQIYGRGCGKSFCLPYDENVLANKIRESEERKKHNKLMTFCKSLRFEALPDDALEEIVEIVEKYT